MGSISYNEMGARWSEESKRLNLFGIGKIHIYQFQRARPLTVTCRKRSCRFCYQFDESVHDGFAADANPAIARAVREGFQPPVPASSQPQPSFATPYNAPANQSGETTGSGSLSQRKAWGVHGNVHTLRQDDDEVSPKGNRYWNGNSTQFGGDDDSKED